MHALIRLALLEVILLLAGCTPVTEDLLSKPGANRVNFGGPPAHVEQGQITSSDAAGVSVESVPVTGGAGVEAGKASPPARLWVVVRNLQVTASGPDTDIRADWEIVQGSAESDARFVLRLSDGDSGGREEHYVDFDVYLRQGSGTVSDGVQGDLFANAKGVFAIMGQKGGAAGDDIVPISGKAPLGGESSLTPPPTSPTAASLAAASLAAEGMPIVLAEARREARKLGSPRGGWSVDFQLASHLSPGDRYDWVVEDAAGNRVLFDVTAELTMPTRPKIGTFSGSPVGVNRLSGQLKMFIERKGHNGSPTVKGELVSNTVTLE